MSHFTKEQRNKSILDDFVYEDTNREKIHWLFSSIDSDHFSILLTFNLHIYKYMQGWVQEYSVDTCRKQNIQYIVVIHPQYRTGVFLKRPEHTKFSVILKVRLQSKFFWILALSENRVPWRWPPSADTSPANRWWLTALVHIIPNRICGPIGNRIR